MIRDLVVLQSKQPLTLDVAGIVDGMSRVLTDSTGPAWRSDIGAQTEVVVRDRSDWLGELKRWRRPGVDLEVVTNDEYCLEDCERIRRELGLARRQPSTITRYLDKVEMKAALSAAGLPIPSWCSMAVVPSAEETLPAELRFPVVVKPRREANSKGVRVIEDAAAWRAWLTQRSGQVDWQVESHIDAPMYFIDAVVRDGAYVPLLLGAYLGPLLPRPGESVLGAVEVPRSDPRWPKAVDFGQKVAQALGDDGTFVTHLEFFDTTDGFLVMEAAARAPGALVSEMGRSALGVNLERLHLDLQAGSALPDLRHGTVHSAWVSVLVLPGQRLVTGPPTRSRTTWTHLAAPDGVAGRYVAAMALLEHEDWDVVADEVQTWRAHPWVE